MNNETIAGMLISLVARKAGVSEGNLHSDTRLLHDLGLYGDDAEELLLTIAEQFQVDLAGFEFSRYFLSEGVPLWIIPRRIKSWMLAKKEPLTIGDLFRVVGSRKWNL